MHLNALKPAAGFGVTWRLELPPYGYLVVSFQSSCKLIQVSTMPQVHCLHLNGWQSQPTCPAPFFGHFGLLANQTGVVTSTGWFFLLFPRFIFFHHLFFREIVPRYASTEWRVSCGWVFRSMAMWLLSILSAYSIWEQCIRTAEEHCVLFSCAALTRNDIPSPSAMLKFVMSTRIQLSNISQGLRGQPLSRLAVSQAELWPAVFHMR